MLCCEGAGYRGLLLGTFNPGPYRQQLLLVRLLLPQRRIP
jgi:hypothetical protein